jgi:Holliday junction resolvase RusA-like endonuclease
LKILIRLSGIPLPWKAPYVGTRGAFSPRSEVMALFREQVKKQYQDLLIEDSVDCNLSFYMPIPQSFSKKKRALALAGILRPNKRPDRTNCAKLYEDCLNGIVIKDDSQIVGGYISKWYDEIPRTEIVVETL